MAKNKTSKSLTIFKANTNLVKYAKLTYIQPTRVDFYLVAKELRGLPYHIVKKLYAWAQFVEEYGIREVRKIPGYHDEPLKGHRFGQRGK